jgi:glycosyltransferase involved in cell wall biosynthesis
VRIAQIAPLHEACPPALYGGTERVVSYLTEELVRLGHEVTLFASGDSVTGARLVAPCSRALRLDPQCRDPLAYHVIMFGEVLRELHRFDVLHFHTDYLHFSTFAGEAGRTLVTLHGRLDLPDLPPVFRAFPDMQLVSISDAQRAPLVWANWRATVYHGLPQALYRPGAGQGDYLVFLGRISPEKGPERAIDIALRAGMKLKIAAKIDRVDAAYFHDVIEPKLKNPRIEFVGEVDEAEKVALLSEARALLFPIDWPEPFGLVMIEAMACGTPVIAFRGGSVAEVIDEGITGTIVASIDEAVRAVEAVAGLDRSFVRARFEQRFSVERMTQDYLSVYRAMGAGKRVIRAVPSGPLLLEEEEKDAA